MNLDVAAIESEILASTPLEHERQRIECARRSLCYWELKGKERIKPRLNESQADFETRPKRSVAVLRSAIEALTAHLYNPGPIRTHQDKAAQDYLEAIYQANQINALCALADGWSTLHGAAAVGLTATPGDPSKAARLDLFGAHELVVWTPEDDPGAASAVCVVGWAKRRKVWTYTLHTVDEVRRYEQPDGGKAGRLSIEPNPYRSLPFAFLHLPGKVVSDFWEGGLGRYLADANEEIDRELSDSAQATQANIPVGWMRGVSFSQRLIAKFGFFNKLIANDKTAIPEIGMLQGQHDPERAMAAVEAYVYLAMEAIGVPRSAVRLDLSQGMSGIAVVMEQLPLLTRAKKRQPLAETFEADLARMVLTCCGAFYGDGRLISAASGSLSLRWPEPVLPVPMPEKDDAEQHLLDMKQISPVMVAQSRFNLSRDEALRHAAQVKQDQEEWDAVMATPKPPTSPFGVAGDQGQGQDLDVEPDPEDEDEIEEQDEESSDE